MILYVALRTNNLKIVLVTLTNLRPELLLSYNRYHDKNFNKIHGRYNMHIIKQAVLKLQYNGDVHSTQSVMKLHISNVHGRCIFQ